MGVSFLLLRATLLDPRFTIIMCGYFLCRRDGPLAVASSLSAPTACWDDAHVDAFTMGPAPASKLESTSLEPTDDAEESTLEPRVRAMGWGAPAGNKTKNSTEHTRALSTGEHNVAKLKWMASGHLVWRTNLSHPQFCFSGAHGEDYSPSSCQQCRRQQAAP